MGKVVLAKFYIKGMVQKGEGQQILKEMLASEGKDAAMECAQWLAKMDMRRNAQFVY